MIKKHNRILFYWFALLSFIIVIIIDFKFNATYDSGDGLQHYLISKYSWQHPELFLDMWGKPFFTLLSSPFAQFGLNGMYVFQATCALFTCFFLFRIANKLKLDFAYIIPVLVFFSPIYFAVINSGLTEICFGCFFMLNVWLIFEKKYVSAAIVASFIPFIRYEAFVVLPLIMIIFIGRKKYSCIPLLFTAFVLYTVIGYFHFKDLWWIISKNKDLIKENYAGMKGSFWHYFYHHNEILSKIYSIFLCFGIISMARRTIQFFKNKHSDNYFFEEVILIYGGFFGCLILHILLFTLPGILNNLGMMRYLVTLIPCAALITIRGIDSLNEFKFFKGYTIKLATILLILFYVIRCPFKQLYYPFLLREDQHVVKAAGLYINPILKNKLVCYLHPYLSIVSNLDPFDEKSAKLIWSIDQNNFKSLPDSTVIVWDSHFAPQEGKLALQTLMNSGCFKPIKHFRYFYYTFVRPFEVWVFIKSDNNSIKIKLPPVQIVSDKL